MLQRAVPAGRAAHTDPPERLGKANYALWNKVACHWYELSTCSDAEYTSSCLRHSKE